MHATTREGFVNYLLQLNPNKLGHHYLSKCRTCFESSSCISKTPGRLMNACFKLSNLTISPSAGLRLKRFNMSSKANETFYKFRPIMFL